MDKEDHLLSRCVVESKFHMNALNGLRETCENSQLRCGEFFNITSAELKEQERRVRTDTLTYRLKWLLKTPT